MRNLARTDRHSASHCTLDLCHHTSQPRHSFIHVDAGGVVNNMTHFLTELFGVSLNMPEFSGGISFGFPGGPFARCAGVLALPGGLPGIGCGGMSSGCMGTVLRVDSGVVPIESPTSASSSSISVLPPSSVHDVKSLEEGRMGTHPLHKCLDAP